MKSSHIAPYLPIPWAYLRRSAKVSWGLLAETVHSTISLPDYRYERRSLYPCPRRRSSAGCCELDMHSPQVSSREQKVELRGRRFVPSRHRCQPTGPAGRFASAQDSEFRLPQLTSLLDEAMGGTLPENLLLPFAALAISVLLASTNPPVGPRLNCGCHAETIRHQTLTTLKPADWPRRRVLTCQLVEGVLDSASDFLSRWAMLALVTLRDLRFVLSRILLEH